MPPPQQESSRKRGWIDWAIIAAVVGGLQTLGWAMPWTVESRLKALEDTIADLRQDTAVRLGRIEGCLMEHRCGR